MTLLLDRSKSLKDRSKTHAFVIGVGNYPHAQLGVQDNLRNVRNLPSAADSAKRMCDWLLSNKDNLIAPLATLEVLISDPAEPNSRYKWDVEKTICTASSKNVKARGRRWIERLSAADSHAFFYCCGHGASHLQQPVLFLEDLNRDLDNVWSHINVGLLAYALRKKTTVSAAFMFSDACGEFIKDFDLNRYEQDCRFFKVSPIGRVHNRVSLLCAASEGQLAYDGAGEEGDDVKFGRFTLTVLKGLSGSSARFFQHEWGVNCRDLLGDLKYLRRVFFSHWGEKESFEPYAAVMQTESIPIVFPKEFELPVVIMTYPPDQMPQYNFIISQRKSPAPPWLKSRDAGNPRAWYTTVPPNSDETLWAIAIKGDHYHSHVFLPKEPLFDQWVTVS